jgi:hypothetical protein
MSEYKVDYESIVQTNYDVTTTDGTRTGENDFFCIPVLIPISMVGELLANYDPTSSTSPVVAYSRPLSRAILDALKRYVGD